MIIKVTPIILLTLSLQLLAAKVPCSTKAEKEMALKIIKDNHAKLLKKTDDPDGALKAIMDQSTECSIPLEQVELSSELLTKLVNTQKFNFWKYKVTYYADYRAIAKEAEEYKKYALILGQKEEEITNFLSEYEKKGVKAQKKNQKKCKDTSSVIKDKMGPVRHQDSLGWCYAYSAADLVSYKLGQRLSAMDFAINYTRKAKKSEERYWDKSPEDIAGGYTVDSIFETQKIGACLETDFPSEDNANQDLKKQLEELGTFAEMVNGLKDYKKVVCDTNSSYLKILPHIKGEDIFNVLTTLKKDQVAFAFQELSCKNRLPFPKLKTDSTWYASREKFFEIIDKQLNQDNPLEFSYDMNILYDPDHSYNKASETYLHSSTIIQRRFNTTNNECEYLVRNSWGRNCEAYEKLECNEGHIWVPKSVLASEILNVTYIK